MPEFKKFASYSLPIIAKDRHRLEELEKILNSMNKGSVAYSELEDYIADLKSITKDFLFNISNNLQSKGIERAPEITADIVDELIILSPPSAEYNCHGWSLGTLINVPFFSTKEKFFQEALLYRQQQDFQMHTDSTIHTFFSIPESLLVENTTSTKQEGSIVIYSDENKAITHSAKYIKSLEWYTYQDELYRRWYSKDGEDVKFDELGTNCVIESYTSKLGLGYLVAHKLEDITPLYGELGGFFDLVVPS